MKRCFCKALIKDEAERQHLVDELKALRESPKVYGTEVCCECERDAYRVIALFEEHEWHSIYAEF